MPLSFEEAKERAVAYIGLNRNRSSGKVKARLAAMNVVNDTIDEVISYLESIDYIDDKRAATFLLRKHAGRQAKSRGRLSALLYAQGIPDHTASELLASGPDDEARAMDLINATFPHGASLDIIYKKLVARGFHPDLAIALAHKYGDDDDQA